MNLFIALLVTRQYLSKRQIREALSGYAGLDDGAFNRMFERDKEELRELGIDLETGSDDKYFDNEPGYRIKRDAVELPEIELTREESAVIGIAAQVWEHAGRAGESARALSKLKSAGVEIDTNLLGMTRPHLTADEPSFDAMWEAATKRIPVAFHYRRPGQDLARRSVQPWGVISWHGRWYMAGYDRDRQEPRVFRLSRVQGDVAFDGVAGSYEVPEDIDLRKLAQQLFPADPVDTAIVRVRKGRGHSLRQIGHVTKAVDDQFDQLLVPYATVAGIASEIASYGPDAVAMAPEAVRQSVVERLTLATRQE